MAGLSLAFSAFLGLSVSAADIACACANLIHQCNNVHNTRISYCPGHRPEHSTRHLCPLVRAIQSILKKANKNVKAMSAVTCSVADIGNHILAALMPPCTSRLPRVLFVITRRVTTLWLELKVGRYDRPYYRWRSI